MSFPTDTIAALATPVGTSALAVVRASGPLCRTLASAIFHATPLPRTACHADYHAGNGLLLDDVLFIFFVAPNSFTGEDTLEISCHGNPFIAQKILNDLLARGCRPAEPGEFSKRSFLNGRMDLSQAEAVMDLIHARSERALAAANLQLRGALGRQMNLLISQLINVLAGIEAYIDFPEEDLPEEDRLAAGRNLNQLLAETRRLLATESYGAMLRNGIKIVILGEPNAGKSSLLNRLVGRERALVSPEPGTTRDYIEERLDLGGHYLRLIDTAGLNPSPGALEQQGMAKTLEQAAEADFFLWVLDSTRDRPSLSAPLAARLCPANALVVLNKSDLGNPSLSPPNDLDIVPISALTGTGLDQLAATLIQKLDAFQLAVGEDLIAINSRHSAALAQAQASLESAAKKLIENQPSELVASDLRNALNAYGEIAGKVDNEAMLDQLFASFCIGK